MQENIGAKILRDYHCRLVKSISVNGTITHLSHVQMEKLESLPPDQKTPKSE
jgi:hypothetical protein